MCEKHSLKEKGDGTPKVDISNVKVEEANGKPIRYNFSRGVLLLYDVRLIHLCSLLRNETGFSVLFQLHPL